MEQRPSEPQQEIPPASDGPDELARTIRPAGDRVESPTPERLGPYVVERILARGGMGEVCLALDPNLNRRVAIKRMFGALLDDADALERFKREARATAAVSHPNIAGIYFVGADDEGRPFLAMEYIDGINLVDVVRHKMRLPYSTLCDWIVQACQGLQAAHKANIIHRDLKPGNLMIARDGTLKIVDFGLAKIFFDEGHKTQTGMVMGTPQYMSPEQGQGRGLDHRSDIYSLGATFYCVLTGRPPFDGPSMVDVMMKHVTSPLVPIYSINPDVPLPLCDILHRMMAKDPNERPQDYEDLIADAKAVKLQMLSRERGAFVGGTVPLPNAMGFMNTVRVVDEPSPEPGVPDSDADLKAILGQNRGGHHSGPPLDDVVTVHSMQVSTKGDGAEVESFWGSLKPRQMLLFGGALALLLLGALALFLPPKGDEPPRRSGGGSSEAGEAVQKSISLVIGQVGQSQAEPTSIPIPPDLRAARDTVIRINDVSRALLSYEAARQELPDSLQALIDDNLIDEAATMDGWGQSFQFRRITEEVLSPGLDGEDGTEDDLVTKVGQRVVWPETYRKMDDDYRARLKSQDKK